MSEIYGSLRVDVSTHSRPKAAGLELSSLKAIQIVSTHSRPKAAGKDKIDCALIKDVSTHSRPKAAGCIRHFAQPFNAVSTHSRPKAAGLWLFFCYPLPVCFNTQPPEGGWQAQALKRRTKRLFQHTAARRRLVFCCRCKYRVECFNTQPPEGGWLRF